MQATTEERIRTLEAEVERLKARMDEPRAGVVGKTRPDFLENFTGIFATDPDFEAMDRVIQEERREERRRAAAHVGTEG
jgi:hypothetical protein